MKTALSVTVVLALMAVGIVSDQRTSNAEEPVDSRLHLRDTEVKISELASPPEPDFCDTQLIGGQTVREWEKASPQPDLYLAVYRSLGCRSTSPASRASTPD